MNDFTTAVTGREREFASRYASQRRRYRHWAGVAMLSLADAAAFALASLLFRNGRSVPELVFLPQSGASQPPVDVFLIFAVLFVLTRYLSGDYSRRRLFWDSARSTTVTLVCLAAPCLLIVALLPAQYSAFAEIGSWCFLLFTIPLMRQGARIAMVHIGLWRVPTALIASGSRAGDVYDALSNTLTLGYDIRWLGFDGADPRPWAAASKLRNLDLSDPERLAVKLALDGCDHAVVATDDMQAQGFADLIQRLMEAGISVAFIPSFRRLPMVGVTTSYFFGKDILLFQVRSSLQHFPSRFAKRLFDIVGSLAALVFLAPLFAAIAVAIKRHDGGPLFYCQTRTGRYGVPFGCLKFRTMAVDADALLERWQRDNPGLYEEFLKTYKLVDDPRITAPGRWLRRSSLDELPQLLNVLRGEMSLVGPRPVLERELIEFYGPAAQLYERIRPGLTGLWQVRGRSDTTYAERVVYDEWYILNWSFWYDIVILLQTVWTVLLGRGAY